MTPQRRNQQREYAHAIRTVRSDRDARHLYVGEPQFMVHPGIRRRLRARLCVWFSTVRLALWSSRSHLVGRGGAPLVSGAAVKGCVVHVAEPALSGAEGPSRQGKAPPPHAQSLFSPSSAATLYASASVGYLNTVSRKYSMLPPTVPTACPMGTIAPTRS